MSVNILIISHEGVGNALVKTLKTTFARELPLPVSTVDIQPDTDPDQLIKQLKRVIEDFDQGDGVLILTDIFGATPSNIAQTLQEHHHVKIITGLNLPMLVRVMNYPQLNLKELTEKALEGGQSGIIECDKG